MHVKMEVDFTTEQDYNLQILKEAKFSEFTLWDSKQIRLGLEFRRFTKLFDKHPNQIRPLGLRVKTDLSAIGFKQKDIFTLSISTFPPWLRKPPSVDLSLSSFAKAETIPEVFKSKFLEICDGSR